MKPVSVRLAVGLFVVLLALLPAVPATGATLTGARLILADSRPSATSVDHALRFDDVTTATTIRCMRIRWSAAADGSGGKPAGLDISTVQFQWNTTFIPTPADWVLFRDNATGQLELYNTTGETPASSANREIFLSQITNGSAADTTYFLRFQTFSDDTCLAPVDSAVIAYRYTSGTSVAVVVDPTLVFTVAGRATACNNQTGTGFVFDAGSTATSVSLGRLNTASTVGGAQDLAVITNAGGGFSVYLRGTAVSDDMIASGGVIADHAGSHGTPTTGPTAGNEGFGYTTSDLVGGFDASNEFAAVTNADAAVLTAAPGTMTETRCVGYQAAAHSSTEAGSYSATVIYTAVPTF